MHAFPAILPEQLRALLITLKDCTLSSTQNIQARYNERARSFRETMRFLKDIGWLEEHNDQIRRTPAAPAIDPPNSQAILGRAATEAIATQVTPYRTQLAKYLSQYARNGTALVHRPTPDRRSSESSLRNFLIASGIVVYRPQHDTYELSRDCAELFLWARNTLGPKSQAALVRVNNNRDRIGTAAELAALRYERHRVGPQWARRVEHVSAANPFACYDIKSVTLDRGGPTPRFIEVKAVRRDDLQFFWSASELEAAELLGASYYLYLLPPAAGARFDCSELEIIQNPYANIYRDSTRWLRQEKVIVCRLKPEAAPR
jgi:hypothetical protein